jgi:hypothetical protein
VKAGDGRKECDKILHRNARQSVVDPDTCGRHRVMSRQRRKPPTEKKKKKKKEKDVVFWRQTDTQTPLNALQNGELIPRIWMDASGSM